MMSIDNNKSSTGATKVTTMVKCPKCGHEYQVEVEVPEKTETPKMTWQT